MKKIIFIVLTLLLGGIASYLFFNIQNPIFEKLSPEAMYQRIIKERDHAISQAVARGDYKCCINPPCTMCYIEANQWNNFTAGTCACDDLIAQGKEPCPQCKKGLCPTCKLQPADN
ncbi:hypothetical protein KJ784_03960 [Patescibacteria group bacterium]|nr:hypothetical protein [Patescibacteria group bacterium]